MTDHRQLTLELGTAPEAALPERLHRLGLPRRTKVTLTRNRTVMVSMDKSGLRIHAGYAWAPDEILRMVILFLDPHASRELRRSARRGFLAFPISAHSRSRPCQPRTRSTDQIHQQEIRRLIRLHEIYNLRHFNGTLATIPIHLSARMKSRLGEFRAYPAGQWSEIVISLRHLVADGEASVSDTLLHEMVHQWQYEAGWPIDHGERFKQKAREVGIIAAATISSRQLAASRRGRLAEPGV